MHRLIKIAVCFDIFIYFMSSFLFWLGNNIRFSLPFFILCSIALLDHLFPEYAIKKQFAIFTALIKGNMVEFKGLCEILDSLLIHS